MTATTWFRPLDGGIRCGPSVLSGNAGSRHVANDDGSHGHGKHGQRAERGARGRRAARPLRPARQRRRQPRFGAGPRRLATADRRIRRRPGPAESSGRAARPACGAGTSRPRTGSANQNGSCTAMRLSNMTPAATRRMPPIVPGSVRPKPVTVTKATAPSMTRNGILSQPAICGGRSIASSRTP